MRSKNKRHQIKKQQYEIIVANFENKDARFCDNSMDKYCDRKDSELTQMEEDVLYMSLFKESLNVVIKEF